MDWEECSNLHRLYCYVIRCRQWMEACVYKIHDQRDFSTNIQWDRSIGHVVTGKLYLTVISVLLRRSQTHAHHAYKNASHRGFGTIQIPPNRQRPLKIDRNAVIQPNEYLGYDFNTVGFAVRDGIPCTIDFCNPASMQIYTCSEQENWRLGLPWKPWQTLCSRTCPNHVPGQGQVSTWGAIYQPPQ